MNSFFNKLNKKPHQVVFYYFIYSFVFVLLHLLLVSIFSFFHFLLDHEMSTIESWISRNSWEIISCSKATAGLILYKLLKLNFRDIKIKKILEKYEIYPNARMLALVLFILVIFYSLILQFGGGFESKPFQDDLFLSSFIGSVLFFGIDILVIFYLSELFHETKVDSAKAVAMVLLVFLFSSKIVLPYLGKFLIFLIVHFVTLLFLIVKKQIGDSLLYLLFIIAPMSSLFGMDLVWDNSYALLSYNESLPVAGIISIWCVALGYYQYSRLR